MQAGISRIMDVNQCWRNRLMPCSSLLVVICVLFFHAFSCYSQDPLKQTVRGIVVDKHSQIPIVGASIVMRHLDPIKGTTSDIDGKYRIPNVPIGKLKVECSFLGYKTILLDNINLSSAKELVLDFQLEELPFELGTIEIKSYYRKDQTVNTMAMISARSFSPEETNRYAGTYGDPARMASNYAGVMTGNDNRNDIVIRGNSSMGICWRVDDIEISNPSHYAALGTTGGPITILNSNLLSHSDFLSGAFPATYGNALAGVFDIQLRNGNNEKREHWIQTGWNGLEAGMEGPLSKNGSASYVIAYRYSILEILNRIGIQLGIDPRYQDLNIKLNLPYKKGRFSILGLGGTSSIHLFDENKKQSEWMFDESGENIANQSKLGVLGLTHLHFFSEKTRLKSSISWSGSHVASQVDTFSIKDPLPFRKAGERSSEYKYTFASTLKSKISARQDMDLGLVYEVFHINYKDSTLRNKLYVLDTDAKDIMPLFRAFGQYHRRISPQISIIGGLHYQLLTFNNSHSLEPRLAIKWEPNELHSFNAGFGMHSQMQARMFYFVQSLQSDGSYVLSNVDLGFSKSTHYVIGYDYRINENLRFKSEIYYQDINEIPVKEGLPAYSALNAGVEYYIGREDSLINTGTGQNYGLEVTLERFFSRQYFYLLTASLFQSSFVGPDGIRRSTAFNSNYLINLVGGYEKVIGKKKNGALIVGGRISWNGGRPYVPFDVDASLSQNTEVLDWSRAYTVRHKDYVRTSMRIGFRRNKAKTSSELMLDLQYRTNYTNIYTERIDLNTGKIHNYQKMAFYPMTTWKLLF